jgi:ABC-2 type transport system permease protein
MTRAFWVEMLKLRRSPVALTATLLMVVLIPVMALGLYSVAQNGGTGALAGKAGALLAGEGWDGYVGAVDQIAAVAMFLGAGVVAAWVFGREHLDRTFPALFALPVSRTTIAGAKFLVLGVWAAASSTLIVASTLLVGVAGRLDGAGVAAESYRLFAVALGATLLGLTMGYVASVGRGLLPAIGAIVVLVAVAQIAVLMGTGGWLPFAVPGLIAVAGTEGAPELTATQIALVPVVVVAVAAATLSWWRTTEAV